MKNLLRFLAQHYVFLLFIALEIAAFVLVVYGNEYPRSRMFASSVRISGSFHQMESNLTGYFRLREINEALNEENTALRNQVTALENRLEGQAEDSTTYRYAHLDYQYIPAKVINSTTNAARNYLTLNKGARDGVEKDMGVVNQDGVVGIVTTVSERYALVIPLIHPDLSISCQLGDSSQVGSLEWLGRDYRYANLLDIDRHITVREGDEVTTSQLSAIFPQGIPVGTIEKTDMHETDAYHKIQVRLAVDFKRLNYVKIIGYSHSKEREELEQTTTRE